jgi:hypothetical protein
MDSNEHPASYSAVEKMSWRWGEGESVCYVQYFHYIFYGAYGVTIVKP